MRFVRLILVLGGLFNLSMGAIFFHNSLLRDFFTDATRFEKILFKREVVLSFPIDPVHQLLIHGFGAGAMILGGTLLYSARDPRRFLPFIFLDAIGRLLYGGMMICYVLKYSLLWTILVFGVMEMIFSLTYLWSSWYLNRSV
jgi:hypothetical protein